MKQLEDIRDIKGLLYLARFDWPVLLFFAGLLLLLFFLWWRYRRRIFLKQEPPQPSLKDLILTELETLRTLIVIGREREFAQAVSRILRSYLELRYNLPISKRTTEEFLHGLLNDRSISVVGHRALLQSFLSSCDLVKFARYGLSVAEMEYLLESAKEVVVETSTFQSADNREESSR